MQRSKAVSSISTILWIALVSSATVASFLLSAHWNAEMIASLGEFQDCSWVHTIPIPADCADDDVMAAYENFRAKSQVSFFIGLIFLIGLILTPILYLRNRSEGNVEKSDYFP